MEDIFGYIILFIFVLGALYLYQSRRLKVRQLPLSVQIYTDCEIKLIVEKQHRKTEALVFRFIAKREIVLERIYVELISKERSFDNIDFTSRTGIKSWPVSLPSKRYLDSNIRFDEFRSTITGHSFPYKTFRLVAEISGGKKYKTHELAFNKNWVIFRPDSGKYN